MAQIHDYLDLLREEAGAVKKRRREEAAKEIDFERVS